MCVATTGCTNGFAETFRNTAFELDAVSAALRDVGFAASYFAEGEALPSAVDDPESLTRVLVVARK